jgi:hypothetical protein
LPDGAAGPFIVRGPCPLGATVTKSKREEFESNLRFDNLAPRRGHVSNFCRPTGTVIEPFKAYYFQNDRHEPLTPVLAGHPHWTRLELAWGSQDNFRMRRTCPERHYAEAGCGPVRSQRAADRQIRASAASSFGAGCARMQCSLLFPEEF